MSITTPAATTTSTAAPVETVTPPVVPPVTAPPVVDPPVAPPVETPVAPVVTPPTAQVVPEKYDLKLPADAKLDASFVESVASYAKENGLSNEQAQKVLDREAGLVSNHTKTLVSEYQNQVKSWQDAVAADKEFGGDKLTENKEMYHRAVERFGGETFKKLLVDSGYEHHPEVFKAFAKIGKEMAEDRIHVNGSQPPVSVSSSSKLYDHPTSNKK